MKKEEQKRISKIRALIARGEVDIKQGKTVPYSPTFMNEVSTYGKLASILGLPIKSEVR